MLINLIKSVLNAVFRRVSRRNKRFVIGLILLFAVLLSRIDWPFGDPGGLGPIAGIADVRDGDSLVVGRQRVRLEGIDAPELAQSCTRGGKPWKCGEDARRHLSRLIGNHKVECAGPKRDQYNRLLARCRAASRDLNRSMVADGMAVSFGRAYKSEEASARRERLGLWAGTFERPQVWRRQHMNR